MADPVDKLALVQQPERARCLAELRGLASHGPSAAAARGLAGDAAVYLNDSDEKLRAAACSALAEMGEAGAAYVEQVLQLLTTGGERDTEVRRQAVRALGACGGGSADFEQVCATLRRELSAPDTQALAVHSLAELGVAGRFIDDLGRLLTHARTSTRAAALSALGSLGQEAEAFAGDIAARLSEPMLRAEALVILGGLGKPAVKHLYEAVDALQDSDVDVRLAAAEALHCLAEFAGEEHMRAAEKAKELLDQPEVWLQASGITALGLLGETLAGHLAGRIVDFVSFVEPQPPPPPPKKEVHVPYSDFDNYMIAVFGPPKKEAAKDVEEEERTAPPVFRPRSPAVLRKPSCAAAVALGRLGEAGEQYAGFVARYTTSPDPEMRMACVEALSEMGKRGEKFLGNVVGRLDDQEPSVRAAALASLGKLSKEGVLLEEPTVKRMVALLADSDADVRCAAALTLADVGGPLAAVSAQKVLPMLRTVQGQASVVALQVLASLAGKGGVLISLTVNGLDYPFMRSIKPMLATFRKAVEEVIATEAGAVGVHVDFNAAGSTSVNVQAAVPQPNAAAASALETDMSREKLAEALGRRLSSVEDMSRVLIKDRMEVVNVRILCQANAHVPDVTKMLTDPRPGVRAAALTALGTMGGGSSAGDTVAHVAALLEDNELTVRAAAAQALGNLGQAAATQAPAVARLLQDPFSAVRLAACEALGRMAEAGAALPSEVIASLEAAATDGGFESVTAAAAEALRHAKK